MKIVAIGDLSVEWTHGDMTGDYQAWFENPGDQPSLTTELVPRGTEPPLGTATRQNPRGFTFYVRITNTTGYDALRVALLRALDTRTAAKALIIADDDDSDPRYWMCNFQTREERDDTRGAGRVWAVTAVVVDGHVYPRAVDTSSVSDSLVGDTDSVIVDNGGHLDAFPLILITPTEAKESWKWHYRRFLAIRWTAPVGVTNYPVQVWSADTTGLVPSKAADETSVGLHVNGVEVDRWFAGANGAAGGFDSGTTRMWANLNFEPGLQATLATFISDGGVLGIWANRVEVNEDISSYPSTGLLQIGDEIFRYRSKDVSRRRFNDVTREYAGAFAEHAVGDAVYWIQHEIFVTYTFLSGIAQTPDDTLKPLMDLLVSTNSVHHWNGDFGSAAEPERPGQWYPGHTDALDIFTGDEDGASSDPYEVIGVKNQNDRDVRWQYHVPNGISAASLYVDLYGTTGAVRAAMYMSADGATTWKRIDDEEQSGVTWSTTTLSGGSLQDFGYHYVSFRLIPAVAASSDVRKVQATSATVGIADPAVATILPERSNYSLDLTIRNLTANEAIRLDWPVGMGLFGKLYIDCDTEQVYSRYDTGDDDVFFFTNRYHIMTKDSHRPRMLRLEPGENIIQFSEAGMTEMDVTITWRERTYV